jgi:pyridoxal phosphate enzyme (YggS family)
VAELIHGLAVERVRANLASVRAEIAAACARAGRDPGDVAVLAAVKYVAAAELAVLAAAGISLVGENRAQELAAKREAPGADQLTWDFIGHLQSRKVAQVLPRARLIHSVASDSVLRELGRHRDATAGDRPAQILVEVNVSGEAGKSGVAAAELDAFLTRCRDIAGADVLGLMTMPPRTSEPAASRRWFAELARLAAAHGLAELSMGTTQDFAVAVEEGATIVRIGTRLYR